jgi:hypothetical protein
MGSPLRQKDPESFLHQYLTLQPGCLQVQLNACEELRAISVSSVVVSVALRRSSCPRQQAAQHGQHQPEALPRRNHCPPVRREGVLPLPGRVHSSRACRERTASSPAPFRCVAPASGTTPKCASSHGSQGLRGTGTACRRWPAADRCRALARRRGLSEAVGPGTASVSGRPSG